MSDRKKGFDPLSSLFDAPDPGVASSEASVPAAGVAEPDRRKPSSQGFPSSLELEDAPTEMAPLPSATDAPEPRAEVAGAGPLKSKPSVSDDVQFIGDLPASDDWTASKPEALFSLNQVPTPDPEGGRLRAQPRDAKQADRTIQQTGGQVALKGGERSLCANLAAANAYDKSHYDSPAIQALVEQTQIVYIAGFFLTVSPPTVLLVEQRAWRPRQRGRCRL